MLQKVKKVTRTHSVSYDVSRNIIGWLMMLPGLILFFVFVWQPLIEGIITSFYETRGFENIRFIGLENYRLVLRDSLFLKAFTNSMKYMLWCILIGVPLPVIAAILLNEVRRGKGFFRFSIYFPCIIPGIVASIMWKFLFQPDMTAMMNILLSKLGIGPLQWLQNPAATIPLIVITMTWSGFGSSTILYLADLQSINHDLYEACEIDGGKFFHKLRYIVLPHMSKLIKMLLIMQIMGVFRVFQQPLSMTTGGPANASTSLMLISYDYAFSYMQIGRSTAVSVITGILIGIMTVIYFRASRDRSAEKAAKRRAR